MKYIIAALLLVMAAASTRAGSANVVKGALSGTVLDVTKQQDNIGAYLLREIEIFPDMPITGTWSYIADTPRGGRLAPENELVLDFGAAEAHIPFEVYGADPNGVPTAFWYEGGPSVVFHTGFFNIRNVLGRDRFSAFLVLQSPQIQAVPESGPGLVLMACLFGSVCWAVPIARRLRRAI
jgi:hypothetical protein